MLTVVLLLRLFVYAAGFRSFLFVFLVPFSRSLAPGYPDPFLDRLPPRRQDPRAEAPAGSLLRCAPCLSMPYSSQ